MAEQPNDVPARPPRQGRGTVRVVDLSAAMADADRSSQIAAQAREAGIDIGTLDFMQLQDGIRQVGQGNITFKSVAESQGLTGPQLHQLLAIVEEVSAEQVPGAAPTRNRLEGAGHVK